MGNQKRGRGRPRREDHVRVRAERRATPDYQKLARALLEHVAMEEAARRQTDPDRASSDRSVDATATDIDADKEANS